MEALQVVEAARGGAARAAHQQLVALIALHLVGIHLEDDVVELKSPNNVYDMLVGGILVEV